MNHIMAVVVTYNSGNGVEKTINSIQSQVDKVIIVDNGSTLETVKLLESLVAGDPEKLLFIKRSENNLAAAQNDGIKAAREAGADWVILSDHDSIFDSIMVEELKKAYIALGNPKLALLAPAFFDSNSARGPRFLQSVGKWRFKWSGFKGKPYLDIMFAIASGSLISLKAIDDVGGMDESYEIDDVDREFCFRLITKGFNIIAVRDAILYHQFGECKDHKMMGVKMTTTNHSANRRYTIYRNRIRTWRRYGKRLPAFILFDFLAMNLDLLRIIMCEKNKAAKLKNVIRGAYRGVKQVA